MNNYSWLCFFFLINITYCSCGSTFLIVIVITISSGIPPRFQRLLATGDEMPLGGSVVVTAPSWRVRPVQPFLPAWLEDDRPKIWRDLDGLEHPLLHKPRRIGSHPRSLGGELTWFQLDHIVLPLGIIEPKNLVNKCYPLDGSNGA